MGKTFADSLTLKNSMKDSLHSNKETTERLKSLEVILKDNVNDLYMKKLKKQKLLVELANLMKHIEKTESTIDIINQQIS